MSTVFQKEVTDLKNFSATVNHLLMKICFVSVSIQLVLKLKFIVYLYYVYNVCIKIQENVRCCPLGQLPIMCPLQNTTIKTTQKKVSCHN